MKQIWLVILVWLTVAAAHKQNNVDGDNSKSKGGWTILKTLLERDFECQLGTINGRFKSKVQTAINGLGTQNLGSQTINFDMGTFVSGNLDLTNIELKGFDGIQITNALISFDNSKTLGTVQIDDLKLVVESNNVSNVEVFGEELFTGGDTLKVDIEIPNWKSDFVLEYSLYPLNLRISTANVTFGDPEVEIVMGTAPADELCLREIVDGELSKSLTAFINDEKNALITELNDELQRIVDYIISQFLPVDAPEVPLPGPSVLQDLLKGTLTTTISKKIHEEIARFVNETAGESGDSPNHAK